MRVSKVADKLRMSKLATPGERLYSQVSCNAGRKLNLLTLRYFLQPHNYEIASALQDSHLSGPGTYVDSTFVAALIAGTVTVVSTEGQACAAPLMPRPNLLDLICKV